ncbi:MAG TPA: hypothetical protein VM141_09530 [Planctomycetota bacterium]|nr:hypothetical protein [Planctomycetota bacterium]
MLESLGDYWPVTLRQVYYRLVAAGVIENRRGPYQKLSGILAQARLDGHVPWDAVEDRARTVLHSAGWREARSFIEDQTKEYLVGYRRDLLQSQDQALEIWIEKDALSHVCHRAAFPYCVPVVVARGFSSVSYVNNAAERIRRQAETGQETCIIYFGDLDPSGWAMLPAMMETLEHEMGLHGQVTGIRCALTLEQVCQFNLPRNPDALKDTDPRAKRYREEFGDVAVELDALPPAMLEDLVRQAVESRLDMGRFRREQRQQETDIAEIGAVRRCVLEAVDREER